MLRQPAKVRCRRKERKRTDTTLVPTPSHCRIATHFSLIYTKSLNVTVKALFRRHGCTLLLPCSRTHQTPGVNLMKLFSILVSIFARCVSCRSAVDLYSLQICDIEDSRLYICTVESPSKHRDLALATFTLVFKSVDSECLIFDPQFKATQFRWTRCNFPRFFWRDRPFLAVALPRASCASVSPILLDAEVYRHSRLLSKS